MNVADWTARDSIPLDWWTIFLGEAKLDTAAIFLGSVCNQTEETVWPKNSTWSAAKQHLDALPFKLCSTNLASAKRSH